MTKDFLEKHYIKCYTTGEEVFGYKEYLKSNHWISFRAKILKSRNVCKSCGKTGEILQLHHISYKNLGNENAKDVLALCEDCHKLVHKIKNETGKDAYTFLKNGKLKQRGKKRKPKKIGKRKKGKGYYYDDYFLSRREKQAEELKDRKIHYWTDELNGYTYMENCGVMRTKHKPIRRYDCFHQKVSTITMDGKKYYYVYCDLNKVFCNRELCKEYCSVI